MKRGIYRQLLAWKEPAFYEEKYKPSVLSRSTLMNFKKDGKIRDYPLYVVSLFLKEH